MRDLLIQYVDEQTPEEAPPFEYVERAARGRKTRSRVTAALVTAVVVAGGATLAVIDRPRVEEAPVAPAPSTVITVDSQTGEEVRPGQLDDGPPPDQFQYGRTVMLLAGEIRITSVTFDPTQPTKVTVIVPRDMTASYNCLPDSVVRILSQDDKSVRLAAYRYKLGPDQPESSRCQPLGTMPDGNQYVELDLRRPLGLRTVYAGAAGERILQY